MQAKSMQLFMYLFKGKYKGQGKKEKVFFLSFYKLQEHVSYFELESAWS